MPWYFATARLSDGFNAVLRLQAPSEDEARVLLRRDLSAQLAGSEASSSGQPAVGPITLRPVPRQPSAQLAGSEAGALS